jgi:hypothetical protein
VAVFGGCAGGGYTDDVNDLLVLHLVGELPMAMTATATGGSFPVPSLLGAAVMEIQQEQQQQQRQSAPSPGGQSGYGSSSSSSSSSSSGSFVDSSSSSSSNNNNNDSRLSSLRAVWQRPVLAAGSAEPTARAYASVTRLAGDAGACEAAAAACGVPAARATLLVFGGIHDDEATNALEVAELSIRPTSHPLGEGDLAQRAQGAAVAAALAADARTSVACEVAWRLPFTVGNPPCARFGHAAAFVPQGAPSSRETSPGRSRSTHGHGCGRRAQSGRLIVCGGSDGSDLLRNGTDLTDVFVLTWHGVPADDPTEEEALRAEEKGSAEEANSEDSSSSSSRRRRRCRAASAVEGTWSEAVTHWRAGHVFPPGGRYLGRCGSAALVGRKLLVFGGGARLSSSLVTLDLDTFELARPTLLVPDGSSSSSGGGSSGRDGRGSGLSEPGSGGSGGALGIVPAALRRYLGGPAARAGSGGGEQREALVPAPRLSHAWWVYGGAALLFGGYTRQGATDDAWLLHLHPTPGPNDHAIAEAAANANAAAAAAARARSAAAAAAGRGGGRQQVSAEELRLAGGGADASARSRLLLVAMLQRFGTARGRGEGAEAYLFPTEATDEEEDEDDLWSDVASSEDSDGIRYNDSSDEEEGNRNDEESEGMDEGEEEAEEEDYEEGDASGGRSGAFATEAASAAEVAVATDLGGGSAAVAPVPYPSEAATPGAPAGAEADAESEASDAEVEADDAAAMEATEGAPFCL